MVGPGVVKGLYNLLIKGYSRVIIKSLLVRAINPESESLRVQALACWVQCLGFDALSFGPWFGEIHLWGAGCLVKKL